MIDTCCDVIVGPVSSVLIGLLGARLTVFVGVVLTMSGFLLSAFASSFAVVCVTYGVLAGKRPHRAWSLVL